MFKRKPKDEIKEEIAAPAEAETAAEQAPAEAPAKPFPPLPIGESAAAGLIAVIFAAVGVLLCIKTCNAANPKEKKPKKPKKEKN